jgi:predicted protein tyrosine phosphatase
MVSIIAGIIKEHENEQRLYSALKKLSPELAEKHLEIARQRRKEELLHLRAIEIVNAGRPRNFWGR